MLCCISCSYNIKYLKKRVLRFNELPSKVRKKISSIPECDNSINIVLFVDPSDSINYHYKRVETIIGPWVLYYIITDINTKTSYKIDRGTPSPYVVYNHKLYVPDTYDFFCGEDYSVITGLLGISFCKPDGKGPNLERGGTPYDYKTRTRTFFLKPVK